MLRLKHIATKATSLSPPAPSRGFRDLPLFWKLLIPFFALMLVVGAPGAFLIVRDLTERAKVQLDQDLRGRSLDIRSVVGDRELYLLESANFAANLEGMSQSLRGRNADSVARLLQSVLALKTDVNVLAATDLRGVGVAEFARERPHAAPVRTAGRRWDAGLVERALADASGGKTSGILRVDGDAMVAIVAPVCSGTKPCAAVGTVVVAIDSDALVAEALAVARPPGGGSYGVAVYDSSGRRIAARGRVPREPSLRTARDAPTARISEVDGTELETLYAPFELQGRRVGTIAVAAETAPAFASVRGTGIRLGLTLLGAMIGIVAIGALLSRAILRQLRSLVATNRALGSGDLAARAPVLGNDELGELALGVNQMADQLQANIETLESRVEERTQEIRRLLRERTEFFAGLSHELRTPLAIILGQSQMLRDPTFRKTRDALEELGLTIGDSAEQLLGVVNEILELARAELGGVELHIEELRLDDVIRRLGTTVKGLTSAAGLKFKAEPAKELPPVQADPERLRQILLNLIDNAVKYTPSGGSVSLGATRRNGSVTVSVKDTGVGIPNDVGERIFEPFFRVPGTQVQRGQASSGLGLALTKRLVEAHGGDIWFESAPDRGTTFNVTLPVAKRGRRGTKTRA